MKIGYTLIRSITVVAALLSAGCATNQKYSEILDSWDGENVNDLISSWGPPSNEYRKPDGDLMYTWLSVGGTQVTANYNHYLNMVTANSVTYWCKSTFTVGQDQIIKTWRWEGNACRAY